MLTSSAIAFDAGLSKLRSLPGPWFIHFQAGFCPDCVRSNPAVERAAERSKVNLLRVDVGTSAEWRATDHPLRVDSRTSLRCIPTLVHWTESGPAERLETELEKAPAERAEDLVMAFIAKAIPGENNL